MIYSLSMALRFNCCQSIWFPTWPGCVKLRVEPLKFAVLFFSQGLLFHILNHIKFVPVKMGRLSMLHRWSEFTARGSQRTPKVQVGDTETSTIKTGVEELLHCPFGFVLTMHGVPWRSSFWMARWFSRAIQFSWTDSAIVPYPLIFKRKKLEVHHSQSNFLMAGYGRIMTFHDKVQ